MDLPGDRKMGWQAEDIPMHFITKEQEKINVANTQSMIMEKVSRFKIALSNFFSKPNYSYAMVA